jgi:acetoin utilization deacetylase AcuC-like enzyme
MRRIGFPWSPDLVTRALASAGGTLAAARDAVETGRGGTLAGGTHHAFRDEGSGYCVFNDIAIAIAELRAAGKVRRAAVIDLDVHQGDGTAAIFAGDPDVFTLSLHGGSNFPFRKQTSTLDVALADGTEDAGYLEALLPALDRVVEFDADIVFYQSGVDGLAEDRLGRLALTREGLAERDRLVFESVSRPLVVTLGGGYADPIELTVEAAAQTYRMLAAL